MDFFFNVELLTEYITWIMFQVHGILKDLIQKSMSETMASSKLINLCYVYIVLYMFKPADDFY